MSQPFVLTAGYDNIVVQTTIFSTQKPQSFKTIPMTNSQVNRIVVTPDNRIALATNPNIFIFDSYPTPKHYLGHSTNVTDLVFFGTHFYSCSEDRTWRYWDRKLEKQPIRKVSTSSALNSLALSPDHKYLFTANEKGQIEMWDTDPSQTKPIKTVKLSQLPIRSIDLSQDGKVLIAACHDGNVFVLDVNYQDQSLFTERAKFTAHHDVILKCAIAPDLSTFVTTSGDSTAILWDMKTLQIKFKLEDPKQTKWVWDAAYTRDSKYVVTAGTDKTYRTWSTETGQKEYSNDSSHSKGITALAIIYVNEDDKK